MKKNLSQWLEYMGSIHVSAIDMGLDRVLPVADELGLLKSAWQGKRPYVFTVAGTNGKGSTTATIAQICQASGLKTALYQSPHLVSFTERVRIDGVEISEDNLIKAFEVIEQARLDKGVSLSFFEMTTLAAFWLFLQANCDVWVLEIGLGGRLDVVNIIDPDLAVITNIGIDHVDWLGDNLDDIGREKAGIIRADIPVILGEYQMPASVYEQAKSLDAKVYQLGVHYDYQEKLEDWTYGSSAITTSLPKPNLSLKNAANAVSAVLASSLNISVNAIKTGMQQVQLAGRFDKRVLENRQWIFDVGHNEAGIIFLLEQLKRYWKEYQANKPNANLFFLFSMLGDKDVPSVIKQVRQAIDEQTLPQAMWHIAAIDHQRAMSLPCLLDYLNKEIEPECIITYENLAQATQGVIKASSDDDLIVAFGSFHTIGESLIALLGKSF